MQCYSLLNVKVISTITIIYFMIYFLQQEWVLVYHLYRTYLYYESPATRPDWRGLKPRAVMNLVASFIASSTRP